MDCVWVVFMDCVWVWIVYGLYGHMWIVRIYVWTCVIGYMYGYVFVDCVHGLYGYMYGHRVLILRKARFSGRRGLLLHEVSFRQMLGLTPSRGPFR